MFSSMLKTNVETSGTLVRGGGIGSYNEKWYIIVSYAWEIKYSWASSFVLLHENINVVLKYGVK